MAAACLCFNLRRATRALTRIYDRHLAPSGVTVTQFSTLRRISAAGDGVTSAQLARAMAMDPTTMSRTLQPLLRRGLLVTVPGRDRRSRHLALTAAGGAVLRRAEPLWEAAQAEVVQRLGAARWEDALQAVLRVAATCHDEGEVDAAAAVR